MRFKRFPRVVAFLAIAAMAINSPVSPPRCRSAEPDQGAKDGSEKNTADHARQAGEEKVRAELKNKTDLKFADVTLADAIKTIADRHHLEIQFDEAALKGYAIDPQTVLITVEMRGVSLRAALNFILSEHDLKCVVENDVLVVTTVDRAKAILVTRAYGVRDLLTRDGVTTNDYDSLINVIISTIAPESWDSVGGQGCVQPGPSETLVISQTADVQEQIAGLFAAFRKMNDQAKAGKLDDSLTIDESAANQAVRKALANKVNLDFEKASLADVVKDLREQTHLEIQLDNVAIIQSSIDPGGPAITQHAKGVTLRSALKLLLRPFDMTYMIREGMLIATSTEKASSGRSTRVYRVKDLVRLDESPNTKSEEEVAEAVHAIAEMITSTVAAPSWTDVGGSGSIEIYGLDNTLLVVSQTEEVQAEIANLLVQLRDEIRQQPATPKAPEVPALRVYELRASAPNSPAMTPQEVAEVVKGLVATKTWTQPDIYIRGVTGKLIVRQTPGVQGKIEKLLRDLDAGQIKTHFPTAFGDNFGLKNPQNPPKQ